MQSEEISLSRSSAVRELVSLPIAAAIFLSLLAGSVWVIHSRVAGDGSLSSFTVFAAVVTAVVSIEAISKFIFQFRHRDTLFLSSYLLDCKGVKVASRSVQVFVPWEQVEVVNYIRLFGIFRLRSKVLARDVMWIAPKGRDGFIMQLVDVQLGERFQKRWLP